MKQLILIFVAVYVAFLIGGQLAATFTAMALSIGGALK